MNQILKQNQKIAFIQAQWHADIVGEARKGFISKMEKADVPSNNIDIYDVPGSLEIPLLAQKLTDTGDYAIIVACGLIVQGGIYRHDFVAKSVLDGMMRVQLDTGVPILSVVLAPRDFHEHEAHHKFFFDHFKIKGEEAAEACIKTLENMAQFMPLKDVA